MRRYAVAMNRSVAANHSVDVTFAGLLEKLTLDNRPQMPGAPSDSSTLFASSATAPLASTSSEVPTATIRQRHATPVPLKETKGQQATHSNGCAELSYQKALQLHRKHKPPTEVQDQVVSAHRGIGIPAVSASRNEKNIPATRRAPRVQKGKSQGPSAENRRILLAVQTEPAPLKAVETVAVTHPFRTKRLPTSRPSSPVSATAKAQVVTPRKSNFSRGNTAPVAVSGANKNIPRPVLTPKASPAIKSLRNRQSAGPQTRMQSLQHYDLPLDRHEKKEQRKSIVSLRVSVSELDKLKDRAQESGISVSAYMRLCVLDAEQLRSQVKQALAAMRSISTEPGSHQLEAPASPDRNQPSFRSAWSRKLVRLATLLLKPVSLLGPTREPIKVWQGAEGEPPTAGYRSGL